MREIEYPQEWNKNCSHSDHYFNMITVGKCYACNKVWGLGEWDQYAKETQALRPPTDAEMEDMYQRSQTESEAYHHAH